ncbi:MAG: adenylosuccinate lyase [Candidatus Neomarinimicrobiota bacterium]|nr:MAG: adenylosuccinate lyase [Candidatus Neomarinimicrobiota bacterium]
MLKSISPLDSRYYKRVEPLGDYFSEYALMGARIWIELQYLLALDKTGLFNPLGKREINRIEKMSENFTKEDYDAIKEIEATLNHDVKSCEVYLIRELKLRQPNMIHFGLTSEDINNLAYSLLLKKYRDEYQLPQLKSFLIFMGKKIVEWKSIAMPARTHGQMASPTTAGKEMAVFASRLMRQYTALKNFKFRGKLNGASGNYSAFTSASKEIDWIQFSKKFIESLDLKMNLATTQIEDHDTWSEYFFITKMINTILIDMNEDIWIYLMLGYLKQKVKAGEVGSSTMPHKVNPINFENSEGNLGIANSLLDHFSTKLSRSRLQRDLSDSTVERNFGVALGHTSLALIETQNGLKKLTVNAEFCEKELNDYPELLAEPIQTILRREGFANPYDVMKSLTRGRGITVANLNKFINSLKVSDDVRRELAELRTFTYTGIAEKICNEVLKDLGKGL